MLSDPRASLSVLFVSSVDSVTSADSPAATSSSYIQLNIQFNIICMERLTIDIVTKRLCRDPDVDLIPNEPSICNRGKEKVPEMS